MTMPTVMICRLVVKIWTGNTLARLVQTTPPYQRNPHLPLVLVVFSAPQHLPLAVLCLPMQRLFNLQLQRPIWTKACTIVTQLAILHRLLAPRRLPGMQHLE